MVVLACMNDSGFQRFCFQHSFLNELNTHSLFRLLPDDVIELIFSFLDIKINYVMSPISYDLKLTGFKPQPIAEEYELYEHWGLWGLETNDRLWDYDRKNHIFHMVDDTMTVHYITPIRRGWNINYKCLIIENFDYSLIEIIRNDLSAQRLKDLYEYLAIDRVDSNQSYHTDINSPFFIFKKLVEGLKEECLSLGNTDDRRPEDINWWIEVYDNYILDIEDEIGVGQHPHITNTILNRIDYNSKKGGMGDLIMIFDEVDEGVNLFFDRGLIYTYDRNRQHKPNEYYIDKSDGQYLVRKTMCISKSEYPDRIKEMTHSLRRAKRNFQRLLKHMEINREYRVMNIMRYAKTGCPPKYFPDRQIHKDLLYQIHNIKWSAKNSWTYHKRRSISETYIYCANIFMIKEYERLKDLYLKSNDKDEKMFYLMKIGMNLRRNTRSHLYDVCYKEICNKYDDTDEAVAVLRWYESYNFLGADKDEELYINPERNPHTYTRPAVSLENNMYRASKDIDYKYDINEINGYYEKMKIFRKRKV